MSTVIKSIFFILLPLLSLPQVRSLASYLEMEGYDRPPFTTLQLESFHRQATQRLEQEKETASQVLVRKSLFSILYHKQDLQQVYSYD